MHRILFLFDARNLFLFKCTELYCLWLSAAVAYASPSLFPLAARDKVQIKETITKDGQTKESVSSLPFLCFLFVIYKGRLGNNFNDSISTAIFL